MCLVLALLALTAFAHPATGLIVDKDGSIYFVDSVRNRVMVWENGTISVVYEDPSGETMRLPHHLFMTANGDLVTIGDDTQQVLLITKEGSATPYFKSEHPPMGLGGDPVALTPDGSIIYITQDKVSRLFVLSKDGSSKLLAGGASEIVDGKRAEAGFGRLHFSGFTFGPDGAMYMTDHGDRIRKVEMDGTVTTVAGMGMSGHRDGEASQALFRGAVGLTVLKDGTIYVAEYANLRVRKISTDGVVTTVAGNGKRGSRDGVGVESSFSSLSGITTNSDGVVFTYEWASQDRPRVRKILKDGVITTIFTVILSGR